ncbi:hypothetical protein JCM12178A_22810 [Salidesulfovibrio brasiliensis]
MMEMKKYFGHALFCAILVLLPHVSSADTSPQGDTPLSVRVVTLYGYAPYCFTTPPETHILSERLAPSEDSRMFRGYSWDVMREALHGAGYTIHLTVVPWKRAYSGILHGEHDILFPATPSTKRKRFFSFGNVPVNDSRALLYVRHGNRIEWTGLDGLDNMDIAVERGFSYGDDWDELDPDKVRKIPVNSIEQGFAMLLKGRVDAFAGYEANWDFVARRLGIGDKLSKLPVFNEGREYAVALKDNADAIRVLRILDARLKAMQQQGRIDALRRKWQLTPLTPPAP